MAAINVCAGYVCFPSTLVAQVPPHGVSKHGNVGGGGGGGGGRSRRKLFNYKLKHASYSRF